MTALDEPDKANSLDEFDRAFWKHVGHSFRTLLRAWGRSWSGGRFAPAPEAAEAVGFYRQLSRYSAGFALTADIALLTMGGALKRKEGISARLGDILSELFLLSAALKRWKDEGELKEDLPLLEWCMADGFMRIERAFDGVFHNLPSRTAAVLLRFILPVGRARGPSDALTHRCAEMILAPSAARDRLTADLYSGQLDDSVHLLERALALSVEAAPIVRKQKDGVTISESEARLLAEMEEAARRVVEVDDFAAEEIAGLSRSKNEAAVPPRRAASG